MAPFRARRVPAARLLFVLALAAAATVAQKHAAAPPDPARVPESLRLKGDPAATADFGGSRAAPAPARGADGKVRAFSFRSRTAIAQGRQQDDAFAPPAHARILGRPADDAAAWVAKLGGAPAHVASTKRCAVIACLDGGPPPALEADEAARLKVWFPELPEPLKHLDGLPQLHIWAERVAALEAGLADVLDLNDQGLLKSATAYGPDPAPQVDVLLFSNSEAARAAADFLFRPESWIPGGGQFGKTPTVIVDLGRGTAAAKRRRFAFSVVLGLQRGLGRSESACPAWMKIGLAHVFERRAAEGRAEDEAGTLPPDVLPGGGDAPPADRAAYVADLVTSAKSGKFAPLCLTPEDALTTRSRLQAWSLSQYLLGADRAKYGELYRVLATRVGRTERDKAFSTALADAFGADTVVVDDGWRLWATRK